MSDSPETTADMTGSGVPTTWQDCPKCGAMRFYPSGRCMQGCDGASVQTPTTDNPTTQETLAEFWRKYS